MPRRSDQLRIIPAVSIGTHPPRRLGTYRGRLHRIPLVRPLSSQTDSRYWQSYADGHLAPVEVLVLSSPFARFWAMAILGPGLRRPGARWSRLIRRPGLKAPSVVDR